MKLPMTLYMILVIQCLCWVDLGMLQVQITFNFQDQEDLKQKF